MNNPHGVKLESKALESKALALGEESTVRTPTTQQYKIDKVLAQGFNLCDLPQKNDDLWMPFSLTNITLNQTWLKKLEP